MRKKSIWKQLLGLALSGALLLGSVPVPAFGEALFSEAEDVQDTDVEAQAFSEDEAQVQDVPSEEEDAFQVQDET